MLALMSGAITGGGLIIAVGAQNSFLLEQALKRHYAFPLALLFIVSDAISMMLGAFGLGLLLQTHDWLLAISRWGGVAFLVWFAYGKWRASFLEEHLILELYTKKLAIWPLFMMALAVTWLNPHFYLDTMILIGSLANQWQEAKWQFVMGGVLASIAWFLSLAFVGRLCAALLEKASFWRWFNRINALLIWFIAFQIATQPL
ncbi:LysE/ArgO family amino acid transporter [Marinomonas aquiplantarum]|uniref:L-lysine exporter family protein LysE/ArgO n=1 Tax=Marinomonas aquiplantarum TaxID=491951 RepID=A0A366CTI4_9GAMM|nr:LysE family transporter [Marinomonas aquiplantarum]RBO78505.1 L-lysine exporter family protein LysE/ArgO [Marinomonas aquiplantarum]